VCPEVLFGVCYQTVRYAFPSAVPFGTRNFLLLYSGFLCCLLQKRRLIGGAAPRFNIKTFFRFTAR
jgi:hypothetical protein